MVLITSVNGKEVTTFNNQWYIIGVFGSTIWMKVISFVHPF